MARATVGLLFIAGVILVPLDAARAADSAVEAKRANEVRKKLTSTIDFGPLELPETTLDEALQYVLGKNDVAYEINQQAFKDESIEGIGERPTGFMPRKKGTTIEAALRRVLARMPSTSGATFAVRGGFVEITTRRYTSPANWRRQDQDMAPADDGSGNRVTPPEISVAFDKRELQDALQEISDATSVNIMLDGRAREKGKTPITATLRDAAVDTVVQLLADSADLEALTVDDVIYVTTKENAKARRERARVIAAEKLMGPGGGFGLGGNVPAGALGIMGGGFAGAFGALGGAGFGGFGGGGINGFGGGGINGLGGGVPQPQPPQQPPAQPAPRKEKPAPPKEKPVPPKEKPSAPRTAIIFPPIRAAIAAVLPATPTVSIPARSDAWAMLPNEPTAGRRRGRHGSVPL